MSVRRVTRFTAALIVATLVGGSVASSAAPTGTATVTTSTKTLAPGVTYRKITDPAGPWIIHVLTVDPRAVATVDTVIAGGTMGQLARPSAMGQDVGALAAVNGDFGGRYGFPLHAFASDGTLYTSGMFTGATFGQRLDKSKASVQHQLTSVEATSLASGAVVPVSSWNLNAPTTDQVVAFTSYGGSKKRPPSDACSVRLKAPGILHWGRNEMGVYRGYVVGARRCTSTAMTLKPGQVVLSSKLVGDGATWIKSLRRRDKVRVEWDSDMAGVLDVVGGNPYLLSAGKIVPEGPCSQYLCKRHPRTAIAVTARGKVMLVVVDGRKSTSVGMTPRELATYLKSLGATNAVNLDGGGSSTMWIKGMGIVNDPTDGSERPVTNSVVILPGADPGESVPQAFAPASFAPSGRDLRDWTVSDAVARRAYRAALLDPASTGGLLDLLASDGSALPRWVLRVAGRFRVSR